MLESGNSGPESTAADSCSQSLPYMFPEKGIVYFDLRLLKYEQKCVIFINKRSMNFGKTLSGDALVDKSLNIFKDLASSVVGFKMALFTEVRHPVAHGGGSSLHPLAPSFTFPSSPTLSSGGKT